MTDVRTHGEAVEFLGTGTPSVQVHGEAVEFLGSYPADVRVHGVVVEFLGTYIGPPNPPENVSGTPYVFSADLSWETPSSGYPVDWFEVRVDGGSWFYVGRALSYRFTGLTPDADHVLEVRARNAGGVSSAVGDTVHTFAAGDTPPGFYRVEVTLGGHTYNAALGDTPERGITLPLILGWQIPDEVDYFPTQADPTSLTFGLLVDDIAAIADVDKGTTCTLRVYVEVDETAEPWQTFDGVVTQLKARAVDHDGGATLVTVFAADDTMRLADIYVGYTTPWPANENVYDRINRICDEAGIEPDFYRLNGGLEGTLSGRAVGPISVLAALRDTLKDVASDNTSEPPNEYYGRYVFKYQYAEGTYIPANTLRVQPFERRVYSQTTLDGGLVEADGEWTKLPKRITASWGIVDGSTFGTPDGSPPFVRNTNFTTYYDAYGSNYSAVSIDNLGEALLPDGSTQLDGWYARELTYRMLGGRNPVTHELDDHLADVNLVRDWASFSPLLECIPVIIEDVDARYRLNGEAYLAGTLTGARLVIPAGGRYYMTLRLRPELIPGTVLP